MATLDYQLGTPLGPDPRAVADLEAIDRYVREVARPRVQQYPKSLPLVEDYEAWRQKVGNWEMLVMVNDTMKTAKAKRDAINAAQDRVLPSWARVEEGAFVSSPPDKEKEGRGIGLAAAVGVAGVVGGIWLAWKVLGPHHFGGH